MMTVMVMTVVVVVVVVVKMVVVNEDADCDDDDDVLDTSCENDGEMGDDGERVDDVDYGGESDDKVDDGAGDEGGDGRDTMKNQ